MPPRAPFCRPSCSAQQQQGAAPAAPNLTLGAPLLALLWGRDRHQVVSEGMLMLEDGRDAGGGVGFTASLQVRSLANNSHVKEPTERQEVGWQTRENSSI